MNKRKVGRVNTIMTAAVVVTYNRVNLLIKQMKYVIEEQEKKIDAYYIIDNCSTDATEEEVKKFYHNDKNIDIRYIKLSNNIGGAGGFYTGIKKAYEDGFDWIILMDDDGMPYDSKCFWNLFKSVEEMNLKASDKVMINALVICEEKELSFSIKHISNVKELIILSKDGKKIEQEINPFNATLISKGLVQSIGFPNKDFFIKCDEIDYLRRARKAEAVIFTCLQAKYFHPKANQPTTIVKILGREVTCRIDMPLKEYYKVRNNTYSYKKLHMDKEARLYLALQIYGTLKKSNQKLQTLKFIWKGYRDGSRGILGIFEEGKAKR